MVQERRFLTRESLQKVLRDKQIIDVSKTTLSTILKSIGFAYRKDNGRRALIERQEIVAKRIKFLREYKKNSMSENPLDVVFLDETWIFQHGCTSKRTWNDANIKSVWNTSSSDGKRYIIVHAGNRQGFIAGADLIFSTKNKSADYHDNMNSELFEKWMEEQLLPRLEKPSLIILDNASYHSRVLEKIPNSNSTKKDIIEWLQSKNVDIPQHAFKCELLELVAKYKPQQVSYAVDELISKMGHSVLRLPPYHCQFNAIELIWAKCKTFYDKHIGGSGYNDEAVLDIWKQSLHSVTSENWINCIQHTERIIDDYWRREKIVDNEVSSLIINFDDNDSDTDDSLEEYISD